MATLNIGGQRVKVDDAFLSMSPEQQQQTVEEIAGQLGAQPAPQAPVDTSSPPAGAQPGTREYADWAAARAQGGHELPQVSDPRFTEPQSSILDPLVQGTTAGWADEARGVVQGGIGMLQGRDFEDTRRRVVDQSRNSLDRERRVNPWGSLAAEVAGAIPMGMMAGGQLAGRGATLGGRMLSTGAVGMGQGAAYGAGAADDDNRAAGATVGGLVGGAVGAAIPLASNAVGGMMQRGKQAGILNQAAKNAPAAQELKSAASELFEQATGGQPIAVNDTAYFRFLGDVKQAANKFRINANLDQKSVGLLDAMMQVADDVSGGGVAVDMKDLHILRQAAQKVATSSEGRDAAFANQVIRRMDDFIQTLKPSDIMGGADPKTAANALMRGISGWSRASKASIIEEAIYKAQNQASGLENGLRTQFRQLLQNPNKRKLFNTAELQAIEDVVRGTKGANVLKLIGKFGFGGGNASNMLGGSIGSAFGAAVGAPMGPLGSAAGAAIAAGGATAARKGSEVLTNRAANRALGAVATEGLKVLPPFNPNQATGLEVLLRRSLTPSAGRSVAPR